MVGLRKPLRTALPWSSSNLPWTSGSSFIRGAVRDAVLADSSDKTCTSRRGVVERRGGLPREPVGA